jgi:hypothetical protein
MLHLALGNPKRAVITWCLVSQIWQHQVRLSASNPSLERAALARAVPAVPLLGCTAGTSTNGRVAAAQFNRRRQ